MIKEYRITEMLYEKCEKVSIEKNKWNCRCPLCGDSTTKPNVKRFYINYYSKYDTYMYKCYRCGESNNVYILCSLLYNISYNEAKNFLDDKIFNSDNIKKCIKKEHNIIKEKNINTKLDINLKKETYSIDDKPLSSVGKKFIIKLKNFIKERKITEKCFIAHDGKYKSRIIIPVINNNNLEYFQGRALYNSIEPKYLNPSVEKTSIIYHKNVINYNKDIFITEGLLDAMSVGNQCTCTLGADLSDKKLNILLPMTKKSIIYCADNDNPGMNTIKKILKKSKYKKILKFFFMPEKFSHIKDMNKLIQEYNIKNIENFIIENSFSYFRTKILMKIK
jgi:DNA primase